MAKTKEKRTERKGAFIRFYKEIMDSPAYRHLSPVSRSLLFEFMAIFTPRRNGELSISLRRGAELVGVNKDTLSKSYKQLEEQGFIELRRGQNWQQGEAREYRLTFEMCNGRTATDEWKNWTPKNQRSENLGLSVPLNRTVKGFETESLPKKTPWNDALTK